MENGSILSNLLGRKVIIQDCYYHISEEKEKFINQEAEIVCVYDNCGITLLLALENGELIRNSYFFVKLVK